MPHSGLAFPFATSAHCSRASLPCHLMSCYVISWHVISSHVMLCLPVRCTAHGNNSHSVHDMQLLHSMAIQSKSDNMHIACTYWTDTRTDLQVFVEEALQQ